MFHHVSEGGGRKEIAETLLTPRFGNPGGNYARVPSLGESLWKKMIGKPYSGKPTVRFDEGELETSAR
ncbi:MAG: hypothetical protein C0407_03515 [Desulfobacca sp.]|nr:hypothetical protein [Desulfobacca sp.]